MAQKVWQDQTGQNMQEKNDPRQNQSSAAGSSDSLQSQEKCGVKLNATQVEEYSTVIFT